MKNMKKTKKFLLDKESTNEEILEKESLNKENLDESPNSDEEYLDEFLNKNLDKNDDENEEEELSDSLNEVKSKAQEYVVYFIAIVIVVILGCIVFNFLKGCFSGEKTYLETTCDWCGKTEDCKIYTVYFKNGYNYDGSVKVDTDCMWFSDKCLDKAENSPYWLKID